MASSYLYNDIFVTAPAVFAVADEYQIMVPASSETLVWVNVGGCDYFDDCCGVLRSSNYVHKMVVPADALDSAGKYTLFWRAVIERKPYFSDTSDIFTQEFTFRPVTGKCPINAYHISDTHNVIDGAISAGKFFGNDLDFLILNGDIPNHSGEAKNFDDIYKIISELTHGEIPVVYARGNHDLRGSCAEFITDYTPSYKGKTYFTFRLGPIWGIVLDCSEDKEDDRCEYGHTIACHAFRMQETEFIKNVIRNAENEYAADGVKYMTVISHTPFTDITQPPIEIDLYGEWVKLLRENIKPDLMLCGHTHVSEVYLPGSEHDKFKQTWPVVTASDGPPSDDHKLFKGGAVTFSDTEITVKFTDSLLGSSAGSSFPLQKKINKNSSV